MTERDAILGELLDEELRLTLHEVCRICAARDETVIELVSEGIAEPEDRSSDTWVFTGIAVMRIRTALRLQRDFELNLHATALALDLLDEIESLKRQLAGTLLR